MPNRTPLSSDLSINLRVLATTDMHGHIGGCSEKAGWAFVSKALAALRAEQANHLLFDNGDFLQGTPICDLAASGALGAAEDHPVIQVMNRLNYDAVGLGNHEFDYGLPFLLDALAGATFPRLCSNLTTANSLWDQDILLQKSFVDSRGDAQELNIGVFSLIPPQVLDWCRVHLEAKAQAYAFAEVAVERITSLRSRGADLVFALCHAGDVATLGGKNPLATEITAIPGLDLVICGHTHRLSPKPGDRSLLFRTSSHSTESAMPLVLPGDQGRFIGCIDLKLQKMDRGWTWVEADCRNIAVPDIADPDILALAAPSIARAQTAIATEIGHSSIDISTHFAAVQCDPATRLAAAAKQRAATPLLEELGFGETPVIVAASPFKTGHEGPACFTAVQSGPITLRNVFDIYPYYNAIDAFEISGAQAMDWLESSASVFFQMMPGQPDQPLWNHQFPTYEFDSLLGLSYQIDLSQPAIYTPDRRRISKAASSRIRDLRLNDMPLDPNSRLVLVTNAYRGGGGGRFPHISNRNRIALPFRDVRTALQKLFADGLTDADLPAKPWQFTPLPKTSVTFDCGSEAARFIPKDLAARLSDLGEAPNGFRKFRLSLDA